jgi:hypothetical protein
MPDAEKPEWQKWWDEQEWTQNTVEAFISGMRSELITPMQIVAVHIEMLKRFSEKMEPEKREKRFNDLERDFEKMRSIFNGMVLYASERSRERRDKQNDDDV